MTKLLALAGAAVVLLAGEAAAQQRGKPTLLQRLGAAPTPARVHRLEVYNGVTKTVKYYAQNVTDNDRAVLREMSDSESDAPAVAPAAAELLSTPAEKATAAADAREMREHRLALAAAYAAGSPKLRQALDLPEPPAPKKVPRTKGGIRPAADIEDGPPPVAIVTLRESGERIACAKFEVSGTWINVTSTSGKTARLKATEISRIEEPVRR